MHRKSLNLVTIFFLIFIFLGGMVIKFIKKLIKWSGASGFDKFLGVIFGLARGLVFLFVIFLLLPSSLKTSDVIVNSKITPIIEQYAPKVEAYLFLFHLSFYQLFGKLA